MLATWTSGGISKLLALTILIHDHGICTLVSLLQWPLVWFMGKVARQKGGVSGGIKELLALTIMIQRQ